MKQTQLEEHQDSISKEALEQLAKDTPLIFT